ncbi:MAG: hypothetical protein M8860_02370 [marine benthic group bacterium]|jgi:hypothetical protein|nr:hypothetical protein [Gemmatimonadota bacterium]MCL7961682.1 hypothetical protein [Candidatus Carthagonibacter metallireducens]MCL7937545.1 hypothetical protein [Gemmatimonadota bacterium]MCL7957095.1 hypothetical protein [Gemmatimonadota bacterium]MCL7964349.1 hypothetical protein [Gemmatimonadota bacterium]
MISETITALEPDAAIELARGFFTDPRSPLPATVVEHGDGHLAVETFRSTVAVSAFPDPEGRGTRVRVSTLRRNDAVGKLLTLLATEIPAAPEGPANASPAGAAEEGRPAE